LSNPDAITLQHFVSLHGKLRSELPGGRGSEIAAVIRIPLEATIEKVDAAKEIIDR
jgi:hypothetical protein